MSFKEESDELIIRPIGIIRTSMKLKFDAPHQPDQESDRCGILELKPQDLEEEKRYRNALSDLKDFSHIWLIWWFHKNKNWRPMVRPPRGDEKRRGVFATRSPHRPNPIGITAVELIKIDKLKLHIGNNDLLDGTPILDIKPYLKSVDSFPDATLGWVSSLEDRTSEQKHFNIAFSEKSKLQISWLEGKGINFIEKAMQTLQNDPRPHRTRRIVEVEHNYFRMGCGAWRLFFTVKDNEIKIDRISPGYPERLLFSDHHNEVPNREAQIEFNSVWPD